MNLVSHSKAGLKVWKVANWEKETSLTAFTAQCYDSQNYRSRRATGIYVIVSICSQVDIGMDQPCFVLLRCNKWTIQSMCIARQVGVLVLTISDLRLYSVWQKCVTHDAFGQYVDDWVIDSCTSAVPLLRNQLMDPFIVIRVRHITIDVIQHYTWYKHSTRHFQNSTMDLDSSIQTPAEEYHSSERLVTWLSIWNWNAYTLKKDHLSVNFMKQHWLFPNICNKKFTA